MQEKMKQIAEYETYFVSKIGKVYNTRFGKIKELTPMIQHGYHYVELCKNNKTKRIAIHRLVAQAFIPNPENKPQVNHKDSKRSNNNVENLEWCTIKENNNHAILYGFTGTNAGSSNGAILTKANIQEILDVYKQTKSQRKTSAITGIDRGTISAICTGRYYTKLDEKTKEKFAILAKLNSTKGKAIQQIDNQGNVVNEFQTIGEAHRETKINRAHISLTCSGNRATAGGFKWIYKI